MSEIKNYSAEQLRKAADIVEKIAALESELATILELPAPAVKVSSAIPTPKKKRGMSAAGKARVAAAQKARWAKINAAKGKVAKSAVKAEKAVKAVIEAVAKPAKKRGMSAAAKAKMSEAAKARWAKRKAAENKPF